MNYEDKILAMLESMQTDLKGIKTDVLELKFGQEKLEARQAKLESDIARLELGQRRIRKDISDLQFEIKEGLWKEVERLDARIDKVASH